MPMQLPTPGLYGFGLHSLASVWFCHAAAVWGFGVGVGVLPPPFFHVQKLPALPLSASGPLFLLKPQGWQIAVCAVVHTWSHRSKHLTDCSTYLPTYIYLHQPSSTYIFLHLPTCPPTHPPTHPPTLPACLPTYLPACLLPTYLPAYLPTYLPTPLPTYLPACLPACLPTYLPTYLPIYAGTYIHTHTHTRRYMRKWLRVLHDLVAKCLARERSGSTG